MTADTKKLLDEALQLPPAERETLAGQLFDSLETDDPDAEAAWQTEIEKRIAELDRGAVELIRWTEARQMIFGDADDSERDCCNKIGRNNSTVP
jgi:putative addiction module component (TIGR02574 family)